MKNKINKVSVITTEKNEADNVGAFIEGLLHQSRKPDEIVICDGGSTDGTIEVIQSYIKKGAPVKLVVKPGNRSVGRNEATQVAKHEYIAVTDLGTVADKDWLKYLIQPFEDEENLHVVGGFFKIKPETTFEKISATQMLADHDNIDPETWLPSSRSIAYTKTAWKKAGGYPEHTRYNEDTPFDLNLKKSGYRFAFAPKAIVYWRPRPNLKEFYKQYYNYAIGDGIDKIHFSNYFKKIIIYSGGIIAVLISLFIPWFWLLTILGIIAYFTKKGLRVFRKYPTLQTLFISPVVSVTNDLADIFGYLQGLRMKS
jgi:glycosyltransferase involved in cell wall biosynthesis